MQARKCIIGERERANLVIQLARFFYIYIPTGGRCTYRNVLRISKSANLCTEPRADLENLCLLSPMASPTQTRKQHRADEEEFTDMASLSPTKVAKVHGYVRALSPMKQSSAGTSKYTSPAKSRTDKVIVEQSDSTLRFIKN